MKCRMLRAIAPFMALLCGTYLTPAHAACVDVLRPADLPSEVVTQNGTKLTYAYQFQPDETYTIAWSRGATTGGPIGPFPLQPGCVVPEISAESDEFVLLEKGCGSFCWYFDVLGFSAVGGIPVSSYEQIFRPLAFDAARNLLAYYPQKDSIAIKNLLTGHEQVFATARACNTGSGLCFGDVKFTPDSLQYTWESTTGIGPGDIFNQSFDEKLLEQ